MEITVGINSLTTTTDPPNVNLPSSGQNFTPRLSARKVSVAGRNRAQDPLVRNTKLDLDIALNHMLKIYANLGSQTYIRR